MEDVYEEKSVSKTFNNHKRLFAIIYFILAILCVHLTNVFIKIYGEKEHYTQGVLIKFLSSLVMFLPLIKKKSFRINLYRLKNQRILFIRAIFLSLATTFWFLGAPSCPIVNLTIISFSIPMILLFLSALLLKEKIGFRRKIYNLFGLIGILTIVNFDTSTSNFFDTLIIFLGAIFFSLFGIYSKKCATQGEDVLAVVCLTAFYSSLILLPFTIYYWTSIDIYQILIYIFLGFLANLNSYFLLKAYQLETASFLAQFMYLEMIFSILTGTFIFNEQIYATTLIGSLFIVMTNTFATLDQKP